MGSLKVITTWEQKKSSFWHARNWKEMIVYVICFHCRNFIPACLAKFHPVFTWELNAIESSSKKKSEKGKTFNCFPSRIALTSASTFFCWWSHLIGLKFTTFSTSKTSLFVPQNFFSGSFLINNDLMQSPQTEQNRKEQRRRKERIKMVSST